MQRTDWSLALLLALIFTGSLVVAEEPAKAVVDDLELLKLFADTFDQVERNYVKDVDRRELMEAAIRGMLSKLDPYSNYIGPEEIDRFKAGVENEFGGVGLQVSADSGELKVTSPILNTPAHRAGIAAGDIIESIDGASCKGMSIDEAVRKMKGKIGTTVEVVIRKLDGASEPFKLARETIRVETVMGENRRPDQTWNYWLDEERKIAYIRLSGFGRHTASDLRKALEELKGKEARGLVLDLRNNPGGLLSSAIDICDMFVEKGRIVSTAGRTTSEQVWDAKKPGPFENAPMAVLVNRYSASASEIVSACLQDHGRAVVVGERSWGKGSVQNIIELENGKSALKLTTAGYKRPSGKNIHKHEGAKETDEWGVVPNDGYEVKISDDELRQLAAARQVKDAIRRVDGDGTSTATIADSQRDKAVEYIREKLGDPIPAPPSPPAAG